MLAYNLSPSFNWDTTGMSDDEMRRFPEELGKLGFVFQLHHLRRTRIDGLAFKEFATALKPGWHVGAGKVAEAVPAAGVTVFAPQAMVGGPRIDGALMAATTHFRHQGHGQGLTNPALGTTRGSTQSAGRLADRME